MSCSRLTTPSAPSHITLYRCNPVTCAARAENPLVPALCHQQKLVTLARATQPYHSSGSSSSSTSPRPACCFSVFDIAHNWQNNLMRENSRDKNREEKHQPYPTHRRPFTGEVATLQPSCLPRRLMFSSTLAPAHLSHRYDTLHGLCVAS